MVKHSIRNYLNNIWCFFSLLGFLALGLIIALSIFIPSEINSVKTIANTVSAKLEGVTEQQLVDFGYKFLDQIKTLDWLKDPFKALEQLLNAGWINQNITACLNDVGIHTEAITQQIQEATKVFVKDSTTQLIAVGITTGIVTLIGYVVIRTYIHYNVIKDHHPFHFIISEVLNILLFSGVAALGVTYLPTHPNLFWIIFPSMCLLELIGALFIAWIIYGSKKIRLRKILNFKGIFKSIIICLSSLVLSMIIIFLIYRFGNIIACICIAIPLIIITMIIIDVNVIAYVVELADNENKDKKNNKKLVTAK